MSEEVIRSMGRRQAVEAGLLVVLSEESPGAWWLLQEWRADKRRSLMVVAAGSGGVSLKDQQTWPHLEFISSDGLC